MFTDKRKMQDFLEKFPDQFISEIIFELFGNKCISKKCLASLLNYELYCSNSISAFNNKGLERLRQRLNNACQKLGDYIHLNFVEDPKLGRDFCLSPKGKESQVEKLKTELEKAYKEFVAKALLKLSGEGGSNLNSVEKVSLVKGASWEDITLKLRDHLTLDILQNGNFIERRSYEDCGFCDTRNKKPDKQWDFLMRLSVSKNIFLNKLSPRVQGESRKKLINENDSLKAMKRKLADGLCRLFGINESPFFDYDEKRGYELKCELVPLSSLRDEGEIFKTWDEPKKNPYSDLKDIYDEQTPSDNPEEDRSFSD